MWPFNRKKFKQLEEDRDRLQRYNNSLVERIEQLESDIYGYKGIELKYRIAKMYVDNKDELEEYIVRAEEAASKQAKIDNNDQWLRQTANAQMSGMLGMGQVSSGGQASPLHGLFGGVI